MKRALIYGITGQDSVYLAQLLLNKGYKVYGTFRRASTPNFWRLMALNLEDKIELISVDLSDMSSIINAIQVAQPDEIYNMAASSYVADSFECPLANLDITGMAVGRILESIRIINKNIRFYQSSSSEMYGIHQEQDFPLNETHEMWPVSPYGIAKLMGHHLVETYRKAHKMFCVSGILFNHESELRGLDFVTRKISNAVAKIKLDLQDELVLGHLGAHRDWGHAAEFMDGVWLMMQQDQPNDYVLATGESVSVRSFAEKCFESMNIEPKIKFDRKYLRPIDIPKLHGRSYLSEHELGWKPTVKWDMLARIMVQIDYERWSDYLDGKHFPWDAPLYPNEAQVLRRCQ